MHEDAKSTLNDVAYDMILLDLGLPDAQGLEVLRRARCSLRSRDDSPLPVKDVQRHLVLNLP